MGEQKMVNRKKITEKKGYVRRREAMKQESVLISSNKLTCGLLSVLGEIYNNTNLSSTIYLKGAL